MIDYASPIRELKRHGNQDEPYRKDSWTYYSNYYRMIFWIIKHNMCQIFVWHFVSLIYFYLYKWDSIFLILINFYSISLFLYFSLCIYLLFYIAQSLILLCWKIFVRIFGVSLATTRIIPINARHCNSFSSLLVKIIICKTNTLLYL